MCQFFWWGSPLYRGKVPAVAPISFRWSTETLPGEPYPTPAGGVVHNQEFSLGGQHKASWFLPFNRGWNGARNPPNPQRLAIDYLWREVLTRRSLWRDNQDENRATIRMRT